MGLTEGVTERDGAAQLGETGEEMEVEVGREVASEEKQGGKGEGRGRAKEGQKGARTKACVGVLATVAMAASADAVHEFIVCSTAFSCMIF